MRVYLVRHADSLPRGVLPVDDHRYLLPEGRKQSRKIGKVLRRLGVELDGLLTSPSMRAVQTAEIVAARLKFRGRIESESALLSDAGSWDKYLAAVEKAGGRNVALVGHEPDLGIALGQALGQAAIGLPKGGLAGLERNSDGAWKALGLLRPASSDWEPIGPGREKAEGDAKALKAEKPGYPGKSGKAEKTGNLGKSGKAGNPGKPGKPGKAEKAGNLGKSGKTEKAEKAVMVTEAATPAKTAKHGKASKTGPGRKTAPAANAEFANAAKEPKAAPIPGDDRKARTAAPSNGKAAAAPRASRKAGTAFANEEAAARPAGKRNGKAKR